MITINKWNETFENADTRKRQRLKSFHCPSGIESRGLVNLLCKTSDQQLALAAFGLFQMICQLSATLPADHRGRLIHSNSEPMTLEYLARLFRLDICHLTSTLELLASKDVNWITVSDESVLNATSCRQSASFVQGEGEGEGTDNNAREAMDGLPCIDGYPTQAQAIAAGGNMGIQEEIAARWWLDRDGEGWQNRNGHPAPLNGWQSNLKSYAEKWRANEQRNRGGKSNDGSNRGGIDRNAGTHNKASDYQLSADD